MPMTIPAAPAPRAGARTFLVHLLGGGLADTRYAVQHFRSAITATPGSGFTDAEAIYDAVFNYKNDIGFARYFDKATHLVTDFPRNRTEDYNLNFIFKNPLDDDVFEGNTYSQLAMLLLFLHLMQIELYGRMREPSKRYQNWLLITSLGAFEALFTKGRSRMIGVLNSKFRELMKCPHCDAQIRIKKSTAPRLLIGERLVCTQCQTEHHFPIGWLLSKGNHELFNNPEHCV